MCKWKSKENWRNNTADKIYFNIKTVTKVKERHYIIIKGSIQREDITIVNIFAPNKGNLNKYRKR